jgi:hypothetical protein
MKRAKCRAVFATLLTLAGPPAVAATSGSGSIVVVHGLPGRALGATVDPALPVDVLVNGSVCLLKNLTFGEIAGPFDLPAGAYQITISPANAVTPCANAAVIDAQVTLEPGKFDELVASVAATVDGPVPVLTVTPVNTIPLGPGTQRIVTVVTGDVPGATVTALPDSGVKPITLTTDSQSSTRTVPAAPGYTVSLRASNGTAAGPVTVLNSGDQAVILVTVVGDATAGALNIVTRVLQAVY